MDKIAVLIPCYNEFQTIKKVIVDIKTQIPKAKIYVYDNNSEDHTDIIAKKAGAVVKYETRQGKGNVIKSMFKEIDAECYIMIDGDCTYDSSNIKEMAEYITKKHFDMVIGDRLSGSYFKENKRTFHNFGNKFVRLLVNKLFKAKITDVMTGYRAFSYTFVKNINLISNEFEIETEMTIKAIKNKFRIISVTVGYKDRPEGSKSKLNTVRDGVKILKTIINLYVYYNPSKFFCCLNFILVCLSLLFVSIFNCSGILRSLIFSVLMIICSTNLLTGVIISYISNISKK